MSKMFILLAVLISASLAETLTVTILCDSPEKTLVTIDRNMGRQFIAEANEPGGLILIRYLDYVYLTGDVNGDGRVDPNDRQMVAAMIVPPVIPPIVAPTMVYRTFAGTTYHKAGCRYLKNAGVEVELSMAQVLGLKPCLVCKP